MAGRAATFLLCLSLALAGCATAPDPKPNTESFPSSTSLEHFGSIGQYKVLVPLSWDVSSTYIVDAQGKAGLWGTCGQCVIANTLNLVTGSAYTEADIVDFTVQRNLCDKLSGGMSLDNMVAAYEELLPHDTLGMRVGFWKDAPTIDEMADLLENGIILNVSVDGEMMREGGHTGEGDIYGTHWILLYSTDRAADGSLIGFWIIDSGSNREYLSAEELSNIYYGHDGTTIIDPTCIQIFGWKYTTLMTTGE